MNDDKKAMILGTISLFFGGAGFLLSPFGAFLFAKKSSFDISSIVPSGLIILGLVLVIIIRVKYPDSKYGKFVMLTYIHLTVFFVLVTVLLIHVLASMACSGCMNCDCTNYYPIG